MYQAGGDGMAFTSYIPIHPGKYYESRAKRIHFGNDKPWFRIRGSGFGGGGGQLRGC
jgi:hypothetical protein